MSRLPRHINKAFSCLRRQRAILLEVGEDCSHAPGVNNITIRSFLVVLIIGSIECNFLANYLLIACPGPDSTSTSMILNMPRPSSLPNPEPASP